MDPKTRLASVFLPLVALAMLAAAATAQAPGESVRSDYEFVAGTRSLFEADYARDNLGDFPRALELFKGNWEVVDWQGRRLLRNTGPRGAAFRVHLPETLPAQFTLETEVYFPHTNQQLAVFFQETARGTGTYGTDKNYLRIAGTHGTGMVAHGGKIAESYDRDDRIHKQLVPIRVLADGDHVKVFVDRKRVANIPNAKLPRTRTLQFENTYFADDKNPMYLGPIRIMAGGKDLYDALATDGRVAIHDILFDTDAATIRAESTAVLAEIGAMLASHADLKLMIEGHTDSTGDFDHNMDLSRRRAESVKQWLVDRHGVDAGRLRTLGLGPTQPKASNADDAGRQQNRRVELVRVD
jgi:OOP family OmpA-OmpF porin